MEDIPALCDLIDTITAYCRNTSLNTGIAIDPSPGESPEQARHRSGAGQGRRLHNPFTAQLFEISRKPPIC
jgi:hypothetical protein